MDLIAELVDAVRESGQLPAGLPAFAMLALDDARAATAPRFARDAIVETVAKPIKVTPRRRAWMLIAQLAPIVLLPLALLVIEVRQESADPSGAKVSRLLSYIGTDSNAVVAAKSGSRAGRWGVAAGHLVRAVTQPLSPFLWSSRRTATGGDSLRENRRLAAIYIASVLGERARDTTTNSVLVLAPSRQRRAAGLAQIHAHATASDVRKARFLVDSVWKGNPPSPVLSALSGAVFVSCFIGMLVGMCAIAAAILFRGGLVMRLSGVELVTKEGRVGGRVRILARQLVVYLMAFPALFTLSAVQISRPIGGSLTVLGASLLVAASAASIAYLYQAVRYPARTLADRIAGTYLVPE